MFHVFTHAWFKALLFLSAGSVMHAMGGELDLRKMSGIKKYMPKTMVLMGMGCLALAGFPGFAGFFSKDQIIAAAINSPGGLGWGLGLVAMLVALMTAYYTFRLFFRVFFGPVVLPANAGGHEADPFALAGDAHGRHSDEATERRSDGGKEGTEALRHLGTKGEAHGAGRGEDRLKAGLPNGGHGAGGHTAPPSLIDRNVDPTTPPPPLIDRNVDATTPPPPLIDRNVDPTHGGTLNDGPVSMWGPLVVLAVGAARGVCGVWAGWGLVWGVYEGGAGVCGGGGG